MGGGARLYKSITDPSSLVAKPVGRDKKSPGQLLGIEPMA